MYLHVQTPPVRTRRSCDPTQPTAFGAAILISPGPGADILRGVPKSFHSRTRVSAFAGASKDKFRTLHLNPPRAPAWPAAASNRNAASRAQSTRNRSVRSQVRSQVRCGTGAGRRTCLRMPDLVHSMIDVGRVLVLLGEGLEHLDIEIGRAPV